MFLSGVQWLLTLVSDPSVNCFMSVGFLMLLTVLIVNFEEDMIGHWIIDFPLCHVIPVLCLNMEM